MKTFLVAYVVAGIVFLAIDAVWLSTTANTLYRPLLGDKLAEQFQLAPAALFYLLYVAGVVVLAVQPALEIGDWRRAALFGAMLGLVAYGTYDLTNQAVLKDWPVMITIADMIWGTVLTTIAATASYFVTSRFV